MGNLSFDIRTPVDFFQKLKEDYSEFTKDKTSSKLASDCAVKAWHLAEWIYKEYNASLCTQFPSFFSYQQNIKLKCPSLQYMQDISNGTKHFTITKYSPSVKNTELHKGAFSNAFSRAFDISVLVIELSNGTKLYFEDEIEKVIDYWESYFPTELGIII